MMEWFKAGGFGMFVVLLLGASGIGYGIKAALSPTAARAATLRGFPALILASALFTFGTNLWAVNTHVSDEAFLKAMNVAADQKAFIAMMGLTEAAQALTLGGALALVVVALRMVVDGKVENRK